MSESDYEGSVGIGDDVPMFNVFVMFYSNILFLHVFNVAYLLQFS